MNNPTLIIENHSGMAWEIKNFQVEFLKNFCFISSMLFHNFLLSMVRNLPQSICFFSFTKILFLFTLRVAKSA